MKARVSHLYKTAQEWDKWAQWTPNSGELIIYKPDEQYPYTRLKVGDGIHKLQDLGFCLGTDPSDFIDGGRIIKYCGAEPV